MRSHRASSFLFFSTLAAIAVACGGRTNVDGPSFGVDPGTSTGGTSGASTGKGGSANNAATSGTAGAGNNGNTGNTAGTGNTGNVGNNGGTGGATFCGQGSKCQPGDSCSVPNGPCVTDCFCQGGVFQCATSCGEGGSAGSTGSCGPAQPCTPGSACTAPDPFNPECFFDCTCQKSGFLSCSETCSGPGGSGGSPASCQSCLLSGTGPQACPVEFKQCAGNPQCFKWVDCVASSGCLSSFDAEQCIQQTCGFPGGPAGNLAANYLQCGGCACEFDCAAAFDLCGGPGTGGSAGAGGGTGQCSTCFVNGVQAGVCPDAQQKCAATNGCSQVGQCAVTSGCLSKADPVACAKQSCMGSPAAFAALESLYDCVACSSCSGSCPITGGCTGGAGGSGPPPPAQTCQACVFGDGQKSCPMQFNACAANGECLNLAQCVFGGNPVDACYQKFQKGIPAYEQAMQCIGCGVCSSSCGGLLPPDFCGGADQPF